MAWAIFSQKMSSVWTACAIRSNSLGYPFEKKLSIRTAWAIHLKKLLSFRMSMAIHLKKKLSTMHLSDWSYLFKDKF